MKQKIVLIVSVVLLIALASIAAYSLLSRDKSEDRSNEEGTIVEEKDFSKLTFEEKIAKSEKLELKAIKKSTELAESLDDQKPLYIDECGFFFDFKAFIRDFEKENGEVPVNRFWQTSFSEDTRWATNLSFGLSAKETNPETGEVLVHGPSVQLRCISQDGESIADFIKKVDANRIDDSSDYKENNGASEIFGQPSEIIKYMNKGIKPEDRKYFGFDHYFTTTRAHFWFVQSKETNAEDIGFEKEAEFLLGLEERGEKYFFFD